MTLPSATAVTGSPIFPPKLTPLLVVPLKFSRMGALTGLAILKLGSAGFSRRDSTFASFFASTLDSILGSGLVSGLVSGLGSVLDSNFGSIFKSALAIVLPVSDFIDSFSLATSFVKSLAVSRLVIG